MANTLFLLQTNFTFNPNLLQHTSRLPTLRSFPVHNNAFKLNYSSSKVIRGNYPKLSIKCFSISPKPKGENGTCLEDNELKAVAISSGFNEVVQRSIKNVLNALQFPVITGVLLALLFMYDQCVAFAASGGRMGGSSFSSSSKTQKSSVSSSSSSSSTRSYSSPSSSSSSSSYKSPKSSSSSTSYSSSSSSSSSTRPKSSYSSSSSSSTSSKPSYSSSSSSSYETPKSSSYCSSSSSSYKTPKSSYSSSWWASSESPKSSSSETPKKSSTTSSKSPKSSTTPLEDDELGEAVGVEPTVAVEPITGFDILFSCGMIVLVVGLVAAISSPDTLFPKKTSVLKLQVGLSGKGKSLQRDLNRIAETADSSSPEGLSNILKETTRALLRQYPNRCISGYSSVDAKKSILEVEKLFNELSIEERSKFDEETLVNVNNIRKQTATTQSSNDISNEYIVVTIIVAAEGIHKLPPINSSSKLKTALQILMTIPSSSVKAVDVLWTPQKEDDILTEQEFREDYPLLRPL